MTHQITAFLFTNFKIWSGYNNCCCFTKCNANYTDTH